MSSIPAHSILAADTNLFLYAANPASAHCQGARLFFENECQGKGPRFALCGLVLLEIYMQLRNPAVFAKPKTAAQAAAFCNALTANPNWERIDYDPEIAPALWKWAAETSGGFRQVIDARLALTLRHHGVTHFATANPGHFPGFGFEKVWNPLG